MEKSEFESAISETCLSTPVKSTRRILFNHLDIPLEERGHFHVDQMFGAGTGILIKHQGVFYLLTAAHVIGNATGWKFNNESPFWISRLADGVPEDLLDIMMPARILHIGDSIPNTEDNLDVRELILVELFFPPVTRMPDRFIDLDRHPAVLLTRDEFWEGQILLAVGYPFEHNSFSFYDEPVDGYTHSTTMHRHIVDGLCELAPSGPFMTGSDLQTYPNFSGASGGVVTDLRHQAQDVRVAGVLVSAGTTVVRFIPSYLLMEALARKHGVRQTPVDPAFIRQSPKHFWALYEQFRSST